MKHRKPRQFQPAGQSPPLVSEAVRRLGADLATLLGLVLFFSLVVRKIFDLWPGIRGAGWLLLAGVFLLLIPTAIGCANWLVRFAKIPAERAQWLATVLIMGLAALAVFLLWDLVGPVVSPWFG